MKGTLLFFNNNKVNVMAKKIRDWQERLLKEYRLPTKSTKEKSILDKKQVKRILKDND